MPLDANDAGARSNANAPSTDPPSILGTSYMVQRHRYRTDAVATHEAVIVQSRRDAPVTCDEGHMRISAFDLSIRLVLSATLASATMPIGSASAQRAPAARLGEDILITGRRPAAPAIPLAVVDKAMNIIGMEGIGENVSGTFRVTGRSVNFLTDKSEGEIPISAIKSVSIDHTTKPLLRGIAGTLAGLAPNGGGQVYGAIRPGAEMVTIFYEDENDALHGAVVLIPKSSKSAVAAAFEQVGLPTSDAVPFDDQPRVRRFWNAISRDSLDARPSVIVALPNSDAVVIPAAFAASAYEQLIAQSAKSGLFGSVWREGDRRAGAGCQTLQMTIKGFRKGNVGIRGAIPVVGMIAGKTLITADVHLIDASGTVLLDKQVEGSKRMMGESIGATKSLAQRATGWIKKVPGFVKGPPSVSRYEDDRVATR